MVSLREKIREIENNIKRGMYTTDMTVCELVEKYLTTKTGVAYSTRQGYQFVQNLLEKESFGQRKIMEVKTSDAKIFFVLYLTHPHVCRHTYCSNMAKSGMNPKTLQYLMGHSDISVTMNVYTHISFDDAEEELKRMEEFRKAQAEVEQKKEKPMSQKVFKVV